MTHRTTKGLIVLRFSRLALLVTLGVLASAPAAQAGTYSVGTGEPAFTNTTTNTNWFSYSGNGFDGFRVNVLYFTGASSSPYSTITSGNLGNPALTTTWANWQGVINTLSEGVTYGMCVNGEDFYNYLGSWVPQLGGSSCSDAIIAGRRTSTTIDRTKPAIQVAVSGADTFTKTVPIPVTISYSDNLAFPFPANFICARTGQEPAAAASSCNAPNPTPQYDYNANCSSPANPTSKVTSFSCTVTDSPPLPDGPVTVCAIAADAAIPDNPASANQAQTADKANLSASQCGFVSVDRTAPQASFTAPTAVTTGTLVTATGTVTDAGSGAGGVSWNWGDNTPASAGISSTHTYTQAGTYTITMSTADAVGNPASKTATITVSAPAPGGGTPGGGTPGGGTPGGGTSTGGGGTVTPPPTAQQIAQQVGGSGGAGATQTTSAGALDVLTARRVKISAKLKSLPLALTAETAGTAEFALVTGGRIVSKSGLKITKPGSLGFKLKLPKKLKAGRYSLKITFTPTGASKASKKTITITFAAAKKKKKAKRSARVAAVPEAAQLTGAPAASLPDGRLHSSVRPGDGIGVGRR